MLKDREVPVLTKVVEAPAGDNALLSSAHAEQLAQSLEEQLHPIIKEAIRDAVRDSARRLARDLRRRLDDELALMIREAVDEAIHIELKERRRG